MTAQTKAGALYICYFGLREPLVQTQVLPYLRQIIDGGVRVSLLTFEPDRQRAWTGEETLRWSEQLEANGISWFALEYHKRPSLPATLYDIVCGVRMASRLMKGESIDVLHARGHVPAAIGAIAKKLNGGKLLFDIRGFMPEEYVDAGIWPAGRLLYRLVKAAERRLMIAADGYVVLTERARRILFPGSADCDAHGRPVEVIPCCVDMARFETSGLPAREQARKEMGLDGRRVIVYLGALGGWYLTNEMADLLSVAHNQDACTFSVVLTQSKPEMIAPLLKERGVSENDFLIGEASPADVPRYLRAADIAISLIKPCYSKQASSPTKIAEYLAAGLPVICNAGIGDLDEVIESDRVGVVVRGLDRQSYLRALSDVEALRRESDLSDRCRAVARDRFDLERVGGPRYRRIYDRLLKKEEFRSVFSRVL